MERKINILKPFFENPNKEFHIREISRLVKINHTTVRQYLNKLVKEGILKLKDKELVSPYILEESQKALNLKLYYNLELIRESEIVVNLEKFYDYPAIVLFGSFSKARDNKESDIDICVITEIKKEFSLIKYEKLLKREITLHKFSKKTWSEMKKSNHHLINSISNGIILSGELEVL